MNIIYLFNIINTLYALSYLEVKVTEDTIRVELKVIELPYSIIQLIFRSQGH